MKLFKNKKLTVLALLVAVMIGAGGAFFYYRKVSVPKFVLQPQTRLVLKTPKPNKVIFTEQKKEELKEKLLSIAGNEKNKFTFYIQDLATGEVISHNADKEMPPASIYKVPLAIIVLRDLDAGKVSLDQTYQLLDKHKPYTFDDLAQKKSPYDITLKSLLSYLIQRSDNAAMICLEDYWGGVDKVQERIASELGTSDVKRKPHVTNAAALGHIMVNLYGEKYLSHENNEYLLNLMSDVKITHQNRIEAGLPEDIRAAHKIGDLVGTSQDAGIVYGKNRHFVIVILNEDINGVTVHAKVQKMTAAAYEFMDAK